MRSWSCDQGPACGGAFAFSRGFPPRPGHDELHCGVAVRFSGCVRLAALELILNAGDTFVEHCDGFGPGLEDIGGVACVEASGMGLLCSISPLRLLESLLEVGKPLFEVFCAHALRLSHLSRGCLLRDWIVASRHVRGATCRARKIVTPRRSRLGDRMNSRNLNIRTTATARTVLTSQPRVEAKEAVG